MAPKVAAAACRSGQRAPPRPKPPTTPAPLAPLDPHKTRALTTIYAPRKQKPRKNKTAKSRMLDELPIKPSLSPFHPLPAIGQKVEEKPKTKVIVLDINKNETPETMETRRVKLQEVLKPLSPLRIHGFNRKNSLDPIERKPQQLVRENTYDVLEPVFLNAPMRQDPCLTRRIYTPRENAEKANENEEHEKPKISPKTRFKKAAMQVAKLQCMPETGKLLCLRERETFTIKPNVDEKICRLQRLPQSPKEKLIQVSEIFQGLDIKGRHRDQMKKENSWF